ncbi:MAG: SsrA-binding protein SmpB [Candidatus Sumerlaeia bacterium]|nr:SsrA-binding protein SmpB [Candidatus Sumerlaeia bacterium]
MADKKPTPRAGNRQIAANRRARFEYEILEKFEAGIELVGPEVKSLRNGGGSITESYVIPIRGSLFIQGFHVRPYENGGYSNPSDPTRERRLLLQRREINKLIGAVSVKGMTIVPLRLYFNERGWAKVEIGLARGKQLHDKREAIKERETKRELAREYKLR